MGIFVKRPIPAVQAGYLAADGGANVSGHATSSAPRVAGSRAPAGTDALMVRSATGGYASIGAGGYYAPKTQSIV